MRGTVEFHGGPLDGQRHQIDVGKPGESLPRIIQPILCVDEVAREFAYTLERANNGVYVATPDPDIDQSWWLWATWVRWICDHGTILGYIAWG